MDKKMRNFNSRLKNLGMVFTGLAICAGFPLSTHAQTTDNAQPAQAFQATEGIVAIVNDEVITYTDVRQRAQFILLSLGVAPNADSIRQAQARAIEGLIDEKLQLKEALEFDLVVTDEEIDGSLAEIAARSNVTPDIFLKSLEQSGLNPRTLREQIRADITWRQLVGGRFGSRVRISDLQIDDTIERLENNMNETQYRISEIFLPASTQDEITQVVQGAWELKRQIENGTAPFNAVARQFSAAPTASVGGEIGWMGESQIQPAFTNQIRAMEKPGISEPIITDNGVYLISLMGKQPPIEPTLQGFELKQISAIGPDSVSRIEAATAQIGSCDNLNEEKASASNVSLAILGRTVTNELSPEYFELFNNIQDGNPSEIQILSDQKAAVVFVCSHIMERGDMPTRNDVETKLHDEMVEMMANRYLRDIRREATIIRR